MQHEHLEPTSKQAGFQQMMGARITCMTTADCIVMGAGLDIARLAAQEAAQVYVCAREWQTEQDLAAVAVRGCSNAQRRGMISCLTAAGGSAPLLVAAGSIVEGLLCCACSAGPSPGRQSVVFTAVELHASKAGAGMKQSGSTMAWCAGDANTCLLCFQVVLSFIWVSQFLDSTPSSAVLATTTTSHSLI